MRTVGLLAVVVLLAAACGNEDRTDPPDDRATPTTSPSAVLAATSWLLVSWADGEGMQPASGGDATLGFAEGGDLSGSTGCNRFAGTWEGAEGDLELELGPMTLVGCTDPSAEAQQEAVISHLDATSTYEGGQDTLRLLDDEGRTLLVYSPVSEDLTGTSWQATGINNGAGAVEADANTPVVTAEFQDDGSMTGNAGCNTYSASWDAAEGSISISGITATEMSCGPDLDTLEQRYLAALAASSTYRVEGSTLELRDSTGALQAGFSAAA